MLMFLASFSFFLSYSDNTELGIEGHHQLVSGHSWLQ